MLSRGPFSFLPFPTITSLTGLAGVRRVFTHKEKTTTVLFTWMFVSPLPALGAWSAISRRKRGSRAPNMHFYKLEPWACAALRTYGLAHLLLSFGGQGGMWLKSVVEQAQEWTSSQRVVKRLCMTGMFGNWCVRKSSKKVSPHQPCNAPER